MLYTNYLKFDDVEAETETETETKQIYREPEGKIFIETVLKKIIQTHPDLKIVMEHITTEGFSFNKLYT